MKIRFAVVTVTVGEFYGVGHCMVDDPNVEPDEAAWSIAQEQAINDIGPGDWPPPQVRHSVVDADVPLPEPVAEVTGEVEG